MKNLNSPFNALDIIIGMLMLVLFINLVCDIFNWVSHAAGN